MEAVRPEAFGARGGAVQFGAAFERVPNGKQLSLSALYTLSGTIAATADGSNRTLIFKPGEVLPAFLQISGSIRWRIRVPGIGPAGHPLVAAITAISPTQGAISLDTTIATSFSGAGTVVIWPDMGASERGGRHSLTYQPVTASGTAISVAAPAFDASNGIAGDVGDAVQLTGAGPSGGLYQGTIIGQTDDGRRVTVSPAIPTPLAASPQVLTWGTYLFSPEDVGKAIEVPGAKLGGKPLETTVAGYLDPFDVNLASGFGRDGGMPASPDSPISGGRITLGWDDTTAVAAAMRSGARYVRMDGSYFLATIGSGPDPRITATTDAIACGEGQLIWREDSRISHGVAPCLATADPAFPGASSIIPGVHLRQARATTTALTVDFLGNSQIVQYSSGTSQLGNLAVELCGKFRRDNPLKAVTCNYRGIGGTTWTGADPVGPPGRNGVPGVPMQVLPPWYVDPAERWMDYIKADAPDVVVFEFTNVDGADLAYGPMRSAIAYTQSTGSGSWKAATGRNPDVILVLDGPQPVWDPDMSSDYQFGSDVASTIQRGLALGGYALANGGRIGLVDINRMSHLVVDGYDPVKLPLRSVDYLPAFSTVPSGLPWRWALTPVQDFTAALLWRVVGAPGVVAADGGGPNDLANARRFWGATGNELDFLIGNPDTTPGANEPAQLQQGYPGNAVRLYFNPLANPATGSAAGMLDVSVDTYRFTTPAACSSKAGSPIVTCTVKVANDGYLQGSVADATDPGTIPAGTTLARLSADGRTLTLSSNVAATFGAHALAIFHEQVPRRSTRQYGYVCPNGTRPPDAMFMTPTFELRGNEALLNLCSVPGQNVFDLEVERWAGRFRPAITSPLGPTAAFGVMPRTDGAYGPASSKESRPDLPIYRPSATLHELYGSCPAAGDATPIAPYDGQCGNHRGSIGAAMVEEPVISSLNLSTQ